MISIVIEEQCILIIYRGLIINNLSFVFIRTSYIFVYVRL